MDEDRAVLVCAEGGFKERTAEQTVPNGQQSSTADWNAHDNSRPRGSNFALVEEREYVAVIGSKTPFCALTFGRNARIRLALAFCLCVEIELSSGSLTILQMNTKRRSSNHRTLNV